MNQHPDSDRYTSDEEATVANHAADNLEMIAVSNYPTRLPPHATIVHANMEPLDKEATLLKKIWCV